MQDMEKTTHQGKLMRRIKMSKAMRYAFAWTIGYFITLFPIYYIMSGSVIMGLLTSIYGVIGAILLLKYGDKL